DGRESVLEPLPAAPSPKRRGGEGPSAPPLRLGEGAGGRSRSSVIDAGGELKAEEAGDAPTAGCAATIEPGLVDQTGPRERLQPAVRRPPFDPRLEVAHRDRQVLAAAALLRDVGEECSRGRRAGGDPHHLGGPLEGTCPLPPEQHRSASNPVQPEGRINDRATDLHRDRRSDAPKIAAADDDVRVIQERRQRGPRAGAAAVEAKSTIALGQVAVASPARDKEGPQFTVERLEGFPVP